MRPRPALRTWLTGLGLLCALAVPAAQAKIVPRAEQGSAPLVAEDPIGLESAVLVQPGQVAWKERLRPEKNVRLLEAAPVRVRPGRIPGLDAGTLMFGYRLSSGVAYCPAIDRGRGTAVVQCFRDFDQDGVFEAGYVSDWRHVGSRYLTGFVHDLGPAQKVRYERVDPSQVPAVDGHFTFVGWRDGQALFRLAVEDSEMDNTVPCETEDGGDGSCVLAGMQLKVTPEDGGARIVLIATAEVRSFQINMLGAPFAGSHR